MHTYHKQILTLKLFKCLFYQGFKAYEIQSDSSQLGDSELQISSVNSVSQALKGPPDPSANDSGPCSGGAAPLDEELLVRKRHDPQTCLKQILPNEVD